MNTTATLPLPAGAKEPRITGVNIERTEAETITIRDVSVHVEADDRPAEGPAPFKGLRFFNVADAHLFFGREHLTAELVDHLRHHPLLAVVGASGSGKSSVVRAGVVPSLRQTAPLAGGVLPPLGSHQWPAVIITPSHHPLESLAQGLAAQTALGPHAGPIVEALRKDVNALHHFAERLASKENENVQAHWHLLLVVDQFEELFTQARVLDDNAQRAADERALFVRQLLKCLKPESRLRVILTLRADFYAQCAEFSELRAALERYQKYIGPMSQAELRQAIEGPALEGNWDLEAGLTNLILRDTGREPGALPLLSHALLETWKRRKGRQLTLAGYAESGGVQAAIATTAERIFEEALDGDQKHIAQNVFLRLTELGDGAEDTRRRIEFSELFSAALERRRVIEVVQKLANARLITMDDGDGDLNQEDDDVVVEVAHEALIREWPRLRAWLEDDREGLRIYRRLTKAANEWNEYERNPDILFRGIRLQQTLDWQTGRVIVLNDLEQEFLESSIAAAAAATAAEEEARRRELAHARALSEEQRHRAELRGKTARRLAAALLVAVVALGVGFYSLLVSSSRNTSLQASNTANSALDTGLALGAEAYRRQPHSQTEVESNLLSVVQCCSQQLRGFLSGHTDRVWSVDFNHDGTRLASGSDDGTIRIWDTKSLKVTEALQQPEFNSSVYSVDFSPDGQYLVIGNGRGQVILYRTSDWQLVGSPLTAHEGNVHDVEFSPDGTQIASGGADNRVVLWSAQTQEVIKTVYHNDSNNWIWDVEFAPDGRTLASTGWDRKVRLWDLQRPISMTLELERTRKENESARVGTSLAFLKQEDKLVLVTGLTEGRIHLWDMTPWQKERLLPVWRSGGRDVLPEKHISYYSGNVWSLAPNPQDPNLLAVGSGISGNFVSMRRLDFRSGLENLSIERRSNGLHAHTRGVFGVAFSPDGKTVAAASQDNLISLWSVAEGNNLLRHEDDVLELLLAQDGKNVLAASPNGQVSRWNREDAERDTLSLLTDEIGRQLAFHPSGERLATTLPNSNYIFVWDLATGKAIQRMGGGLQPVTSLAYSQDGLHLASGHGDSTVVIWKSPTVSVEKYVKVFTLKGTSGDISSLAFHPARPVLASGGCAILVSTSAKHCGRGEVRLWNYATGHPVGSPIDGKSGQVRSVAFSPDGTKLAIGSDDKILTMWSLKAEGESLSSREELFSIPAHAKSVSALAFSPNGQWVASGSADYSIRLWSAESGQKYGRGFRDHDASIVDLVFDQEGNFLYSASLDNTAIVHDLRPETWYDRACTLAGRPLTDSEEKRYLDPIGRLINLVWPRSSCAA